MQHKSEDLLMIAVIEILKNEARRDRFSNKYKVLSEKKLYHKWLNLL